MLKITNLGKYFGEKKVLNGLNAEFEGGLNFILGASGSGKTTLLKILSGIDKNYDGEVLFKNKKIKEYNQQELNNYYYNSIGFVWQNFHLIDYMTVEENIQMVLNLGDEDKKNNERKIRVVLRKLGIEKIANAKVNTLSGGQKQRVAIARVLVKEPEVIIADEPTGALDKQSAKAIMEVLKDIAKEKLVIVVTHDKSILNEDSNVYELYKGILVEKVKTYAEVEIKQNENYITPKLSLRKGFPFSLKNFKARLGKNVLTGFIIALAALFLVIKSSGEIVNEQQQMIDLLIEQRGDKLRDVMVASERLNTFGSDENTAFKQDVSEFIYEYNNDPRIENFLFVQFINGIEVSIPGVVDNYIVDNMSTGPTFDTIIAGRLPKMDGREVAISELLVENLGLEVEDVIGQTIDVSAWTYDAGPLPRGEVDLDLQELTIVGVVESTVKLRGDNGERIKTDREDTMFFSLDIVNEIKQAMGAETGNVTFTMRVKEIEDIMPIVEEFNAQGIITIGEFEDVKDLLKISDMSSSGVEAVTMVLAIMGILSVVIISTINFYLRRYEFAVLKINGYSKASMLKIHVFEAILLVGTSIVGLLIVYIPVEVMLLSRLNINMSVADILGLGTVIIICMNMLGTILGFIISANTNISKSLMTGDR